MTLKEEVEYGMLTIKTLSEVITENLKDADNLDIRLRYKFINGIVEGRLLRFGNVIVKREYKGKYLHEGIARMHADFRSILTGIMMQEKQERERLAKIKAQDEKMNAMPNWSDRHTK